MNISIFEDFYSKGLYAIPIIMDAKTRQVTAHPEHITDTVDGIPTIDDVRRWKAKMRGVNATALKLFPPYGMLDFDIKNTSNKNVYTDWFKIVDATNPDVLRKVCIESTRSGGYHVYIKYEKLDHKIPLARSEGKEVISVYTGGLLSYCDPSPGYKIIHNDWDDIDYLTQEEFDLLISTAALFNEDKDYTPGSSTIQAIEYPVEYESILMQFDDKCDDDTFETLLNSIELYRVKDNRLFRNKKFVPFLRKGSTAVYSAKAYFKSKRLLIFSASIKGFPSWHDSAKSGDNRWSLSPAKILYYKNNRSWPEAISEAKMIAESAGIDLIEHTPIHATPIINADRLRFPYDIFPDAVTNFINAQVIQKEYMAGAIIGDLSTAIGNQVSLEAQDGYIVKPILYLAIVAPPGASKSPALKKAFGPLEKYDNDLFDQYNKQLHDYKERLAIYEKNKKSSEKPEKPNFPQTLIKDSTIEMVIKILSHNTSGCCVLADELSGFLNRMNQYKTGDEVQKWLEMWSGSPVLLQRITRDENKVKEPYCSVVGGIQPGVLESLSKAENEHNGFFHRFLFVYPEPQQKNSWVRLAIPDQVKHEYNQLFHQLIDMRSHEKMVYQLSADAWSLYTQWFDHKNERYNRSPSDHVKGIIAKYQDYCLRFAILLQVTHDGVARTGAVTGTNMERAIRLTEYFFGNMNKAIRILKPESPIDKLQGQQLKFFNCLPQVFTMKTAIVSAMKVGINENTVKTFLRRSMKDMFIEIKRGEYEKAY